MKLINKGKRIFLGNFCHFLAYVRPHWCRKQRTYLVHQKNLTSHQKTFFFSVYERLWDLWVALWGDQCKWKINNLLVHKTAMIFSLWKLLNMSTYELKLPMFSVFFTCLTPKHVWAERQKMMQLRSYPPTPRFLTFFPRYGPNSVLDLDIVLKHDG